MNEPYTQLPNRILQYLMIADLNMTQFRIMHAVIRQTYGFHKDWNQLALSFLAEQTQCNKRQVTRELGVLIARGILLERKYEGKRELRINPSICSIGGNDSTPQDDVSSDSLDTSRGDSLDTSASDSLVTHIKKDLKEKDKEKNNTSNLHSTDYFLKEYDSDNKEQIHSILQLYFECYKSYLGKEHPKLKKEQQQRIYSVLEQAWLEGYNLDDMIENYFETMSPVRTDFNINHFATEGMLLILSERVK